MADSSRGVAIGIDAGGTRTVGILVDEDCRELRRAEGGAGNPQSVGVESAWRAIADVYSKLAEGSAVKGVCLGQAGVDSADDRKTAESKLRLLVGELRVDVRNDAAAALGIVGAARPAMVVVAGTGSIVYGERADGSARRIGGLGAMISDPGSANSIGLDALRYVAHVLDGAAARGALAELIIKQFKLREAPDIVSRFQASGYESPLVASIAPLVAKAFADGDAAARAIVNVQADSLAADAKHLAREIRTERALPVLLVGKVFAGIPELRERVRAAVKLTGSVMVQEAAECVLGAARLAVALAKT